jgi:hypothetical protein
MVSSGAPAIDALTGGLPRGCLTEICGPASSGRTTILLAALAAATRRGEFCVVVDASDALDPQSAASAGVDLERLLWVRCGEDAAPKNSPRKSSPTPNGCPISRASLAREVGKSEAEKDSQATFNFNRNRPKENGPTENVSRQSDHRLEQVLRATDLLLESGGFGLIVLDLGDMPPQSARRIPLTTWFRFRRAIEHTPTILLAIEQQAIAGSCSSLLLQLGAANHRKEMNLPAESEPSRKAVAWESPARQCRMAEGEKHKSHRDATMPADGAELVGNDDTTYDAPNALPIAHPEHTQLFTGLNITAELIRSRLTRKPAHSVDFITKTAWAG